MSAPRAPDRTVVTFNGLALIFLVAVPTVGAGLLMVRWPHAHLRGLVAFFALLPVVWSLVATALVRRTAGAVRLRLNPITGARHALGTVRVTIDLVHAGSGPGAAGLELWQTVAPPRGDPFKMAPQLVPWLARGESRAVAWELTIRERGALRMRAASVWCSLPGALQSVLLSVDDGRAWTVGPARYRVREQLMELLSGRRQAAGRMVVLPSASEQMCGLREYRPGDSPRLIAWSRSLKEGPRGPELSVREYEDPSDEDVCLVIDVHVPPGDESVTRRWHMEKAIAFTAAATRMLLAKRYRVRVRAAKPAGTLDVVLATGVRDDMRLDEELAALEPIAVQRRVDDLLLASIREARGAVLFVSLRNIAQEEVDRRLPVVSVLPGWIDHLVSGVVGL